MVTYKDFGVKKETATLSNGVKILHFNKKNSPISITFASKCGSRYDPDGKDGLAHLLEHSVFLGTNKFKDKKDLTYYIEDVGGVYGAYTTTEYMGFDFLIGDQRLLPHLKTIVSEIFNNAQLDSGKIESEKNIILNEIDSNQGRTSYILYRKMLKLLLGSHKLTRDVAGDRETLKNLHREDLVKYYKDTFLHNFYIVSCGDVLVEKIVALFDNVIPFKKFNAQIKPVNILGVKKNIGVQKKDIKIPNVKVAFPVCDMNNYEEFVKLKLLLNMLGNGRNSLLMDKFRTNENILYGISTANHLQEDFGYAYIDFQVQKEKIPYLLKNILTILENIRKGEIDEKLLEFTKNRIINRNKITYETSEAWVDSYKQRAVIIGDAEHGLVSFLNGTKQVTASDLVEIANKYFVTKRMCVAAVGKLEERDLGF